MFRVQVSGAEIGRVERGAHLIWEGSLGNPPGPDGGKSRPEGTRWSELKGLVGREAQLWVDAAHSQHLWRRVLEEGAASDVWTGDTPETWSPLGQVSYSSFGELRANTETATEFGRRTREAGYGGAVFLERDGVQMLGLDDDAGPVGAVTFAPFAFIVPIDAGADEVLLELVPDPVVLADLEVRDTALRALGLDAPIETVVWRLYRGSNSSIVDGIAAARDGLFKLATGVVDGSAYLVGRLAMMVNRNMHRPEHDPWFRGRIDRATFDDLQLGCTTAEACAELSDVAGGSGLGSSAIIAVHGTMGCAIPLARSLAVDLADRGPILRFEHDTWHQITLNATELSQGIQAAGLTRVLLVAHSRGGLVARQALGMLRDEAPTVDARLIAVGTPFAGTPVVGAAESGLLGFHAVLGAMRVLAGPVLDGVSRITGLLVRGTLPAGIRAMHPDESYLAAFAGSSTQEISAIAGYVDPNGTADSYGIGMSLKRGAIRGIFHDSVTGRLMSNDYVVPTDSALARIDRSRTLEVECDHFSYFNHPDVRAFLVADQWRAAEDPPGQERLTW